MTLLVGLTVVLGIVLLIELVRIFELTNKLKNSNEYEVSYSTNRLRAVSWILFVIWYFGFFIFIVNRWGKFMLPESASEHGESIDFLFSINWAILLTAFVITHLVLVYFVNRYVSVPGRKADFVTHNNKLEALWTVIPASALAVIIIMGLKTWDKTMGEVGEDAINIELYAQQFNWTARYAGNDNKLGKANVQFIDASNPLGLINNATIEVRVAELEEDIIKLETKLKEAPEGGKKAAELEEKIAWRKEQLARVKALGYNYEQAADEAANDDKLVKGEFYIPVGKMVNFQFRSQDVIHSAYMPHFRAQMNCVPGMITGLHFRPTITTEEMRKKTGNPEFNYLLLCNKICGAAHYNMQMNIVVVTEEEYNKWLADQKTFKSTLTAAHPELVSNQIAQNN